MVAFDSAADPAYADNNWQAGENGGTGFTPWTFTRSAANQGFFFTGQSGNNSGQDPSPTNQDIDTAGRSLGIASGSGANSTAIRGFAGGALSVGQTFQIDLDNGYIDNGGSVGIRLLSDTTSRFTFQFLGGTSNYTVNGVSTGLSFSGDGLRLSFTLTDTNTFSTTITRFAGGAFTTTGTLANAGDLTGFEFFVNNAGYGGDGDAFINNMSVVPEPGSALLALVAGAPLLLRRRR
jgi:hypothetical protein